MCVHEKYTAPTKGYLSSFSYAVRFIHFRAASRATHRTWMSTKKRSDEYYHTAPPPPPTLPATTAKRGVRVKMMEKRKKK